jgi:hypothetical protein
MPSAPRFRAYVDWSGDANFTGIADEITADLLTRTQVEVKYGRDEGRALGAGGRGELNGELDNRTGIYSPESTDLPLVGDIQPGRDVLLNAEWLSQTYGVYRGKLDDFDVQPGWPKESVDFSCLDALAGFTSEVTTGLYRAISTGKAIGIVLDAIGWPATKRDLDNGATTIPWFWLNRVSAQSVLQQLVDSEGPPALLTMDAAGNVVFRDRHHRLTRTASVTSQATFGTGVVGAIPVLMSLVYNHGIKEIINSITFEQPVRAPAAELEPVWTLRGSRTIADGETLPISVASNDPFTGAVVPVAGIDFQVAGNVTVTLSRTDGQAVTVFVKATGGTAVITDLQLRAYPVSVVSTEIVSAEDAASKARFGTRTWPSLREPVWASVADARAIADLILAQRAQRIPTVRIEVANRSDAAVTQQLTRNLSDRIRLVIPDADLDSEFYIERIEHTIAEGGKIFTSAFFLERVPNVDNDWLVLNSSTKGRLNVNTLGGVGLANSSTVFRLDSTQGRLDANLLGF